MKTVAILAALALVGGGVLGCSTKSTVTEEDRVVLDMMVQISNAQIAIVSELMAGGAGNPAALSKALSDLQQINTDGLANGEQLMENWGPPKQAITYTTESAATARAASKKSHAGGFWAWMAAAAGTAGAVALGVARKFGRFIPGFGPIFEVGDKLLLGIEAWMEKRKAVGDAAAAGELATVLEQVQSTDPKVKAWVEKQLESVKKRFGVDLAKIAQDAKKAAVTGTPTPPVVPSS